MIFFAIFFYLAFSPRWAFFAGSVFFYFFCFFLAPFRRMFFFTFFNFFVGSFSLKVFFLLFLPFFGKKRQFSVVPIKKGQNRLDKIRLSCFKWQMKKGRKNCSFNNRRNAMDSWYFDFFCLSMQMHSQNHLQKSGFLEGPFFTWF